jgi:tRNA(Ile)-lysidine synthase
MLAVVRQAIERYNLLLPGDSVVVGVSGGPDSVSLLHVLLALSDELGLTLHVAHLNHRLRGAESEADAAFVRELATSCGLKCTVDEVEVSALAARLGLGEEEAARQARYAFLAQVARQLQADAVAVGHNADDQAETILMHLLRGSGLDGLRGMAPRTVLSEPALTLIRPLLGVPRAAIELYCRENHLQPRFDRSNLDRTFFRNRLRLEILPALEEIAPGTRQRLRQLAELAAADFDLLQGMLDEVWPALLIEVSDEALALDLQAWRDLPLGLRRRALRRAAFQLRPSLRDFGFAQVEAAREIAETGATGARASLPGQLSLTVSYERLWISGTDHTPDPPEAWPELPPGATILLHIPGRTQLPGDWSLEAAFLPPGDRVRDAALHNEDPWKGFFDADCAGTDLVLRTREPGDRFQPLGLAGHSASVSDFMINERIPAAWRGRIPILARAARTETDSGDILWIVGFRLDERVRVRRRTRRLLHLTVNRPADRS